MHPGNILVRKKASRGGLFNTKKPHIVFLDVGMTAELAKNDRENLLEFFKAVALRDGRTAAKRALKLSKKQNCPNPEAFIEVRISFPKVFICQKTLYVEDIVNNISNFVITNTFVF